MRSSTHSSQATIRAEGMAMLEQGLHETEVVATLGVSRRTVSNWRKRRAPDREKRSTHRGQNRLTPAQTAKVKQILLTQKPCDVLDLPRTKPKNRVWCSKQVRELIKKECPMAAEATMSCDAIRAWLNRNGFYYDSQERWW